MGKIKKSSDDLVSDLREQVGFIEDSAYLLDSGKVSEAKRIALAIRVILHDTSNSKSLLGQLGRKDMDFYDTSIGRYCTDFPSSAELLIPARGVGGDWALKAPQDAVCQIRPHGRILPFEKWWNGLAIAVSPEESFSRKDIVLTVANKLGGAHVEPEIDEVYDKLMNRNSLGWFFLIDGSSKAFGDPVPMTVRQIAYELLESMKDGLPDLGLWVLC